MYIKIRKLGCKPDEDDLIITITKGTAIKEFRDQIEEKWGCPPETQKLLYKGKLLDDNYRVLDYGIRVNDVVQLMISETVGNNEVGENSTHKYVDIDSKYYKIGDQVDVKFPTGQWEEARITSIKTCSNTDADELMLFFFRLEDDSEPEPFPVTFADIRPRAKYIYDLDELYVGQNVMVSYNRKHPLENGVWVDIKIDIIKPNLRNRYIRGTLLNGLDDDELIFVHHVHNIMRIEEPSILTGEESNNIIPLRKSAFRCTRCKDDKSIDCTRCRCPICKTQKNHWNLLRCNECGRIHHTGCLKAPLPVFLGLPDEWYCPECKRDETEIVKAGDKLKISAKNANRPSSSKNPGNGREWGRGMACVGRTKECTIVPMDHIGPIPGVEVGTCWKFRVQVSEAGVHRPPVAGIHGRENKCAFSLVLSGGYEDDLDFGLKFRYTGSGGRDLSGNKRSASQSCNQKLTRMNKALALCCNAPFNDEVGAKSKDWKKGSPVRVVRNYKLGKRSQYAPKEGNRYDGLYKVVSYKPRKGRSGHLVWSFILYRDDPDPPPWTVNKKMRVIYPEGYLQALKHNNSPEQASKRTLNVKSPNSSKRQRIADYKLPRAIKTSIKLDLKNEKIWAECATTLKHGKEAYLAKLQELFICAICQEVVFEPVTLTCGHNICKPCLRRSVLADIKTCPCCRADIDENLAVINNNLQDALLQLFPGYDKGR